MDSCKLTKQFGLTSMFKVGNYYGCTTVCTTSYTLTSYTPDHAPIRFRELRKVDRNWGNIHSRRTDH